MKTTTKTFTPATPTPAAPSFEEERARVQTEAAAAKPSKRKHYEEPYVMFEPLPVDRYTGETLARLMNDAWTFACGMQAIAEVVEASSRHQEELDNCDDPDIAQVRPLAAHTVSALIKLQAYCAFDFMAKLEQTEGRLRT